MNETLARFTACFFVTLLLAAGVFAIAEEPATPPGATQLDTIVVHPQPSLDDSLRLLRLMAEQQAPCLGCDAVLVPERDPAALSLLKYLLMPAPPPDVDEGTRLLHQLKTQDDPTLEYLAR